MRAELEILDFLARNNGEATLRSLLQLFQPEERALAELSVFALARAGSVVIKEDGQESLVQVAHSKVSSEGGESTGDLPTDPPKVVATVPLSLSPGLGRLHTRPIPTVEAFEWVLSSTKHYLKLCLPFPEEAAIAYLGKFIATASERGVRIKLLTRELLSPSTRSFDYAALVRSVARFADIYKTRGSIDRLQVRDFHSNISLDESGPALHYESIHAKVLISDGVRAYVGSAEFRGNSLLNNFELGFVVSGVAVQEIEALYDLVWNAAIPVTYAQVLQLGRRPRPRTH